MYYLCLALCFVVPMMGWAQSLTLDYGVNRVDINADGVKDMIVRTRWENFNAHSFDRYLIAVTLAGEDDGKAKIYEVPLGETSHYRIQTDEGAECLRSGYTFRLDSKNMLEIIHYELEAGKNTYCEPAHMSSIVYRLTPSDGDIGLPYFYLKLIEKRSSRKKYIDITRFIL